MKTFTRWWPIAALLLLFVVSIFVRAGQFDQDYVANQGYKYDRYTNTEVYLHTGYVFDIYERYPLGDHLLASYIGHDTTQFLQSSKIPETVYTSFPAPVFAVPYVVFKVLHAPISYLSLQIFSLAIGLICVLSLYWLIWLLTRHKLAALLGAAAYLFATISLQNHMNVYWAHQLLQPFFIGSLILFVKRQGLLKWWEAGVIALVLTSITWTGAIAVVGYTLFAAYMLWKTRDKRYWAYIAMLPGTILAVGAIYLQTYLATGANLPDYLHAVTHRVGARSITGGVTAAHNLVTLFLKALWYDFGLYALAAFVLSWVHTLKPFERATLFVASLPILESFILLGHDVAYGFGRLKWLLPAALLIGLYGAKFATNRKKKIILTVIVAMASLSHIAYYWMIYG